MLAQPRLDVIIGADTRPFGQGVQNATAAARTFGTTIQRYLGAAAVAGATRSVLQLASELSDLSLEAGTTIEWLQAAAHAAKLSGSGMQDVVAGMVKLRESMVQAAGGSRADLKAFQDLGITLAEIRTQSPEEVFLRMMDAIEKTGGRAKETTAAIALLGRSGKRLMPAAIGGFRGEMDSYRKGGRGLSTEEAAALDNVGDMIDDSWERLKVMGGKGLLGLNRLGLSKSMKRAAGSMAEFTGINQIAEMMTALKDGGFEGLRSKFAEIANDPRRWGANWKTAARVGKAWAESPGVQTPEEFDASLQRQAEALRKVTGMAIGNPGMMAASRGSNDAITRIGGFFGPAPATSEPRAQALLRPIHYQLTEIVRAVKENTATTRDSGL